MTRRDATSMAAGLAVGSSLGAAMKELANTQGGAKPADLRRISAAAGQALVGNDADRLIVSYIVVMVVMVAMRMMMMTVAVAIPRPTLCYLGDLHFHLTLHHAGGGRPNDSGRKRFHREHWFDVGKAGRQSNSL